MRKIQRTRPVGLYLLILALLFQGLSGVAGGIGLIADPSGGNIKIPIEWLQGSPFNDYLIPGIILFFVLGIFPLIVLYGLWMGRSWSWFTALLVGLALIVWIVVEIIIIGYQPQPPLQLIYGILGVIILVLVFSPSVKRYFFIQTTEWEK
jgi:hypothetical protein